MGLIYTILDLLIGLVKNEYDKTNNPYLILIYNNLISILDLLNKAKRNENNINNSRN